MITRMFCFSFAVLLLCACDSNLTPDYMLDTPRIIALEATDPEVAPENNSTVAMRLIIGGKGIDQAMSTPVRWFADPMSNAESGIAASYSEGFVLPLSQELFAEPHFATIKAQYDTEGWADIPVTATITVSEKRYDAMKFLRLTKTPQHKNPKILGITAAYLQDTGRVETTVATEGETIGITAGTALKTIGFRALTEDVAVTGNDKLLYRWYITVAHDTGNKLYTASDDDELFPGEKSVDEISRSVVFSLNGKTGDDTLQEGNYDLFLVIRDKAADPQSAAEDRRGLAVFYIKLKVAP